MKRGKTKNRRLTGAGGVYMEPIDRLSSNKVMGRMVILPGDPPVCIKSMG